jgi:hypothetical protein
MATQKYSVNQYLIETILSWVKSGEIAIPEIQRPFVWDSSKVRDLVDSLYQGYPVGYLIAWKNPNVKLKDGTIAEGKKILIDGQQRVTALTAAIIGQKVINKDYKQARIIIAFNPVEDKFEVSNPAIQKDVAWIDDISKVFSPEADIYDLVEDYCSKNANAERKEIYKKIQTLQQISSKQIGLIELASDLDIETVTEIFIRINSQGVVLSQADFAMSKIASNDKYNGSILRKCIDYFCHLSIAPEFYSSIAEADRDFANTIYFSKMAWLRNENDDLYDPDYTDLLRVAFTSEFNRGKLSDLVSLLSGRNFETRTYEDEIEKESYAKLENGILNFINETNFKRFIMIIKSAGFISASQIRSKNAMNFAYIVYLKLKSMGYQAHDIERYTRKWFVLSVLTGRYSGSPESMFDFDIKNISNRGIVEYINDVENGELSEAYWKFSLPQRLDTSVASSPFFNLFLASQVKAKDKGFLSKDITVYDLIDQAGDVHHIFPRDYLKKNNLKRGEYNQIANYVYMQSEINIKIGNKAPKHYFGDLKEQCTGGQIKYGGITDYNELLDNLRMNCIPEEIFDMDIKDYNEFLRLRRELIAKKIENYYKSL